MLAIAIVSAPIVLATALFVLLATVRPHAIVLVLVVILVMIVLLVQTALVAIVAIVIVDALLQQQFVKHSTSPITVMN
jgi:hypothetical protein